MKNKTGLAERQVQMLQFLRDYFRENGVMPTHREIKSYFGYKGNGWQYHLDVLIAKGFLGRGGHKKQRGLYLIDQTTSYSVAENKETTGTPFSGRSPFGMDGGDFVLRIKSDRLLSEQEARMILSAVAEAVGIMRAPERLPAA